MKSLSQASDAIVDSLRQKMATPPSSSMPTDGSVVNAGQSITLLPMPPAAQLPVSIESKASPPDTSTARAASSKSAPNVPENWRSRPISESVEAQNELTALLTHTYIIQKKYGEQADHVKIRDDAFQKKLGRFCIDDVHQAFEIYTSRRNDIPSPADIINILEPPPPIFDKAMFVAIKQKGKWNMYVTPDEREYCRRYEEQELGKLEAWERNNARRIKSAPPEYLQIVYEPEEDELGEV